MRFSDSLRQHWAALRALLVLTVLARAGLPAADLAGRATARPAREGRGLDRDGGRTAGGQRADRPARSPTPTATRCRSISRAARRPPATATTRPPPARRTWARRASSTDPGQAQPVDPGVRAQHGRRGTRRGRAGRGPFCTGDGVGAVLSVIGPRDAAGNVVHPTRVVSVNEPCATTHAVPGHL